MSEAVEVAERNIVLTGFMGTGKTSIGRAIAARLGRPFVDLDDVVVERAGKSIARLFEEDGEAAFRALEAAVCQEMRAPASLVVAAGGGAVIDPANREALAAGGVVICLDADPETIATRLAGQNGRPLLSGADRPTRIAALLAQRAGVYAALPHHIDTNRLSVQAAAERALGIAAGLPQGGYRQIVRTPEAGAAAYDILIAEGVLAQAGARLRGAGLTAGRCAIVTNPTVAAHHLKTLQLSLVEAGFEALVCEIPDGEAHKTLATAGGVYEMLAEARLSRNEPVVALGGGVAGDLGGFVAATWLRGVPFVQAPTSLLSMIDASVGGKVAVDLPQGKNLVGAFKQPALVLIDPGVLSTLPSAEYRSGLAEVAKTAIIGDPVLFEQLAGSGPTTLVSMIADTVRVKEAIVERDPYENGDRAWLNLGHTFGHALELVSGFSLRHGEAVGLGLLAAVELSVRLGRSERTLGTRIRSVVKRLGLPTHYAFDPAAVRAAMNTDKKRRGQGLRFVLPLRIGQVVVVDDVPEDMVLGALEAIRAV